MKREIEDDLRAALVSDDRRVVLLEGARQVGKSYLVNQILSGLNVRSHAFDLEKDRILPVIEAAVQTCEGEAEKGNISVRYSCDKDCTIPMNAPLLEQAIVNLLVNAITCSTSGSEVFIEVTGGTDDDDPDGFVRITVRDKGCGIGTKHIPRVFERFYRSDRARNSQHGGTGLGLAIVKHISQAHNGSVELKSVEGEGSEFTLVLPG